MRTRIWIELAETRFHANFLSALTRRNLLISKYVNIFFLALSTSGGIMGWGIWQSYTSVACIILAAISLFKLISPEIMPSEKRINNLHKLHDYYCQKLQELDELWMDVNSGSYTEREIFNKFSSIVQKDRGINQLVNDTILYKPKKLMAAAKQRTDLYLNKHYN
jgi:hypothetical protein